MTRKADDRGRVAIGSEYGGKHVNITVQQDFDLDKLREVKAVHYMTPSLESRSRLYAGDGYPESEAAFGIHWDTGPIWAEKIYADHENQMAISDFNAMNRAAEGAIVAGYYGQRESERNEEQDYYNLNTHIKLGICPPGSYVKSIPFDRDTNSGKTLDFVKSLPLIDTVEVTREEAPELFEPVRGHAVYEPSDMPIQEAYEALRY